MGINTQTQTEYFCILIKGMKIFFPYLLCVAIVLIFITNTGFKKNNIMKDELKGAWMHQNKNEEHVLQFIDGYNTHSIYSKAEKKFVETRGGTYTTNANKL